VIVEVITEDAIRVTVEDETTEVNVMVEESASPLIVEVGVQGPPGGATVAWANVTGKPATFPVAVHTHAQSETHDSPDTDASPASIHHTLGTGANQAAPGNHTHSFEPANANIQLHIASTSNPHSVTAGQIGAEPAGSVDTHEAEYSHPSLTEKSALAGTSGTPGSGNRYVTNSDSRLSDARTPTAHTHTPGDTTQDTTHRFVRDDQITAWDAKVATDDARLSDARTPTAHASTHAAGQSDALTPSAIGASPSTHDHSTGNGEQISYTDLSGLPTLGTAAALNVAATGDAATGEVVKGDDTRLTDNRTPTTHAHAATDVTEDTTHRFATDTEKSTWNGKQNSLGFTPENSANKGAANGYAPLDADQKVPTANLPTMSAGTVAWDDVTSKPVSFTPSAHASTHATGQADAITAANIGAADASHTHAFLGLTDTPSSYSGQASRVVRVNSGATALEFVEASAPGAHASTHADGGSDEITPAAIGAAADDHTHTIAIGITVDGSGSALTTGSKGFRTIPDAATIVGWQIVTDQSGSIVFDIKKCAHANFPTTSSICASAKPTVSSAQIAHDETLTGWTTAIDAGDILEFVVDSASTVTRATLTLHIQI